VNIPKRVLRGLKWLREEGGGEGLQLSSAVADRGKLMMSSPSWCVVALASGHETPYARSKAYGRVADKHGQEWLWRHGFEGRGSDPDGIYALLNAEWFRVLELELEKLPEASPRGLEVSGRPGRD
jgi:hypothetical protein